MPIGASVIFRAPSTAGLRMVSNLHDYTLEKLIMAQVGIRIS